MDKIHNPYFQYSCYPFYACEYLMNETIQNLIYLFDIFLNSPAAEI